MSHANYVISEINTEFGIIETIIVLLLYNCILVQTSPAVTMRTLNISLTLVARNMKICRL